MLAIIANQDAYVDDVSRAFTDPLSEPRLFSKPISEIECRETRNCVSGPELGPSSG